MYSHSDNPQEIIDAFFETPQNEAKLGVVSILQALKNDLNFCVGGARHKRNKTKEEIQEFYKVIPTFTCLTIYFTSIDLLSRISRKHSPVRKNRETNEEFFKFSAKKWFEHSDEEIEHLWKLRNEIVHHYKLTKKDIISPYGGSIMKKSKDDFWNLNVTAMYGNLVKASRKLHESLSSENEHEKQESAQYINDNGVFYLLNFSES